MGIVFRQSVKTFIVTASGAVLGALLIYLSTKCLPAEAFGFIRNLTYTSVVLSQVCMFGLANTMYVFLSRYSGDDAKKRSLLTICFVSPAVITILLSLLAFAFRQQLVHLYKAPADIANTDKYFVWFPIYVFLWCYITMLELYAYLQMKTALSTFMREILVRLLNITLIVLFFLGIINFSAFVGLTVLITAIPIIILWKVARTTKDFHFSLNWKIFSRDEYKSIFSYSWSHLLSNISATLIDNLPILLLGLFDKSGLSAVGIYAVAVYISSVSQIPYRSMSLSTTPILTEAYHKKDFAKVRDLFNRSSINILIVVMVIFNLICLNLHNAVAILPKTYQAFGPIVIILMLGKLADMGTGLNAEMISISEYYKFNFRISLMLPVLLYISSWLLIPKYSLYGAAWGTTISIIIFNLCKMAFLWWKWKLIPFSKNTLLILLAGSVSALAGYFLPYISNPIIDTLIRSIVIIAVYAGMIYLLQPSADLKTYIASVRKDKRLF